MEPRIAKLKSQIQNRELDDSLIVLQWSDTPFVAYQYLNEIITYKHLEIEQIDDFDEEFRGIHEAMFTFNDTTKLKLYIVDNFKSDLIEELGHIKNTIVICHKIDEGTKFSLMVQGCFYEVPELKEWHILGYMQNKCQGVNFDKLKWLCDVAKKDIYRISNELDKVACYPIEEQDKVFDEIYDSGDWNDMNGRKIYDITNAITGRNTYKLSKVLEDIDNMDVESYGLVTILKKAFKNILCIQTNPNVTAEELGISVKQFEFIKKVECGRFPRDKLLDTYKFLVDYDYKLKNGELDMSKDRQIDYIICKVLS